MTQTRHTARARAAWPAVLDLLASQPTWTFEALQTHSELPRPVLQELLSGLVGAGHVRQRFVAAGDTASEATYSLIVPLPEDARPLSPVEDQVLAYLLGRKETLGNIVAALPLSKSAVVQALISLDERGLVSCRFVGHLAIFSRHT